MKTETGPAADFNRKPESSVAETASARSNQVKPNRLLCTSAIKKAGLPAVKIRAGKGRRILRVMLA
jgi:hypothetical protein